MKTMTCKLIEEAQAGTLTATAFQERTTKLESICESSHFDVSTLVCAECGQTFLHAWKEFTTPDGDDDQWTFWVPLEEDKLNEIKTAEILLKATGELVFSSPHICWNPDGQVVWAPNGFSLAFIVFLP